MTKSKTPELFYRVPELARMLGVTTVTLYNYWRRGEGPPYRHLGRRRVILKEDAHRWIASLPKRRPETPAAA